MLPRRPWTYQSNVAQIDKILLDYFGSSTLAKIELDDPNANYTNLRLMVQYGNDIAALKLNDTVFRTELDWHAGNISDLRASTSSEFTRVNSELGYLNANLSEHKINTTAQFKRINEDFASHVANYDQFKASTSTEFTQVKNAQAQMRADITVMSVEMDRMKERIRVMEEDYKVLLITWIVSIIVFALILVGIIFFLWKKNQQPESFESIPLRPARGYSYT